MTLEYGLLLLVGALVVAVLAVSAWRRRQARWRGSAAAEPGIDDVHELLDEVLVRLEDAARGVRADVDGRTARLEALVQTAGAQISRLEQLLGSVARGRPHDPRTPPAPQSQEHEPAARVAAAAPSANATEPAAGSPPALPAPALVTPSPPVRSLAVARRGAAGENPAGERAAPAPAAELAAAAPGKRAARILHQPASATPGRFGRARFAEIYALADGGTPAPGIAEKTGLGLGEVELILNLRAWQSGGKTKK